MTGLVPTAALDRRTWTTTGSADGGGAQALEQVGGIGDKEAVLLEMPNRNV